MPFGLTNASQTIQRLVNWFGAGMDFVFIYIGWNVEIGNFQRTTSKIKKNSYNFFFIKKLF